MISSYGEGEKAILKTEANTEVLQLIDCSYVTISNLHFIAPNGGGIWIDTLEKTSEGITIDNVLFTDMQNYEGSNRDNLSMGAAVARAAIMIKGLPARSRYAVNDLTITNCEVYNCANGFLIWGSWNDEQNPWCKTEEEVDPIYNEGVLVKNCYFHEMDAEAVVVGICDGALVTHCRAINCCQGEGIDEKGIDKATGKVLVEVSPDFFRPTDVVNLWGDPTKARKKLGWNPQKTSFEQLVKIMVDADMAKVAVERAEERIRTNLAEYLEKGIVK